MLKFLIMKLESSKKMLAKNPEKLLELLTIPKTYKTLMPSETDFQANDKGFSFQIKTMPKIALKFTQKTENKIIWEAADGKIPFILKVNVIAKTENNSEIYFDFEGNLNPMLQMMVKKPLKNFLEKMIENTKKFACDTITF